MPIQNHIHLSENPNGGEPEYAPSIKWKVQATGWSPAPELIGSVRRTLTGKLKVHHLTDGVNPRRLMNWQYSIRVSDYWGLTRDERYEALLAMQGKKVYFIDHDHVNNDEDHRAYIRSVYVDAVASIENISPMLETLYFSVNLVDDSI